MPCFITGEKQDIWENSLYINITNVLGGLVDEVDDKGPIMQEILSELNRKITFFEK